MTAVRGERNGRPIGRRQRRRLPHGVAVAGVVLAGGRGSRAGGRDKGLLRHRGRPMAMRAAAWLAPYCTVVAYSANRNLSRYAAFAELVVTDATDDYRGPLAGLAAALSAVRCRVLLTCPCDVSAVPADVPGRLLLALRLHGADVAVVRDRERRQPLLMALRTSRQAELHAYLADGGRSVHGWLDRSSVVEVPVAGVIGNRNLISRPGPFGCAD